MVPTGLSYAVTMRVGLYYGAGNLLAARSAGRVGIGFGASLMFAFAALFWLLPDALVGLFIDRNDPAFAAIFMLAVQLVMVAACAWLFAFTFGGGAQGIWWGLALGLACAAVALTFGFEWRMKRLLGKAERARRAALSV
ncbi:hypothetical protein WR25_27112 [Diploscapter pachys]|uniref:Uncharacterized protein n=1 Tax=Diploscapter pachys TaxID=2018661 RepID=A0A2A2K970_9BILA|nr:hypothetical protein WR25_27112 [Diploscapter pachys]